MKKTFLSILDFLLLIISPFMVFGLFLFTMVIVFGFAMDLGMDKASLKNFIYSLRIDIPFFIYFILLYSRIKSRGGFDKLLKTISRLRGLYLLIKIIDKVFFNPFILLLLPIIFLLSVFAAGILPLFGTVWKEVTYYWLISLKVGAGCILYIPIYFFRYLIKKSLKSKFN